MRTFLISYWAGVTWSMLMWTMWEVRRYCRARTRQIERSR